MPTYVNGSGAPLIERLVYTPTTQGGVDLETSPTKTISATAEAGVADYTTIHTLPAPPDARIAVLRGNVRLSVTIDSWGGGGAVLNYRVKNGTSSLSTGTIATAAATGQKFICFDITTKITGAQTYTLFLWVDAGTCVISEVTFLSGVGSCQTVGTNPCMSLTHYGQLQFRAYLLAVGGGNIVCRGAFVGTGALTTQSQVLFATTAATARQSYNDAATSRLITCPGILYLYILGTAATDLNYIADLEFVVMEYVG